MRTFIDAVGREHPPADRAARIVCLVPSITELLCELGAGDRLVGRTGFCIHPREWVRSIPKVGGTKDVDLDHVRRLVPTHVIVNVDENRQETAAALAEFVPQVIVTHPVTPADNLALFNLLGGIFGCEAAAERLASEFQRALGAVHARPAAERVLYLIWRDPWMTVARDTYISRMLALFNWQTEPATAGVRYPVVALADYADRVDRVLLSSEPYPFRTKHCDEIRQLIGTLDVALIDGEMTSWYGSRAIAGLRYLDRYTRAASHPRVLGAGA